MGRKQTIGLLIRQKARERAITVAEIARETGAKPNTIRVVLHKAASYGEIHLVRFYRGRSARTMQVISHDDGIESRLNGLICGLCGKVTK